MSDTILCPVCETENASDATNCEVCGERLVPPAEGEEVAPEENVSAMLDVPSEMATVEAFSEGALETGATEASNDAEEAIPADVLYSPVDGKAYHPGSPEYEDGFGPMGEELVRELPEELQPIQEVADEDDHGPVGFSVDEDDEANEFAADSDLRVDDAPPVMDRSSAAFAAAFPVKEKARPQVEPLPTPGVSSATLTLYINRQPVHTHSIETDETLIGRRDPRADAFPELDLTDWDPDAHVSRKHAYIYRQNRNYTVYAVSNAGTQVNADLLNLGDRRALKSGDVVVLAGRFAMKFEIPD